MSIDRLDEASRPRACQGLQLTPEQQEPGNMLRQFHEHFRNELQLVVDLIDAVRQHERTPEDLHVAVQGMTLRHNMMTVGAACGQLCQGLTAHHTIEDVRIFPQIADHEIYGPVIAKLQAEHVVIHDLLVSLDNELENEFENIDSLDVIAQRVADLQQALLSHFAYEEEEMTEPLGTLGITG
jgi:hypothetical protein